MFYDLAARELLRTCKNPLTLQEIMGHASITTTPDLYGHLYPGDMDGYADRLGNAAELADPARIRPDDVDDVPAAKGPGAVTWGNGGALGGTRTPAF